jgi:hypothetical protein
VTFSNRAWLLALGLIACACSSDDAGDEPKDALVGTWGVEIPGSPGCVLGSTFAANGVYEGDTICPLDDGSYGVEAELGSYSANRNVIDFVPTQASCRQAGRDHGASSVHYSVTSKSLTLVLPSGALILEKLADGGAPSGVIHYGCANADGFVRSDLTPL